jgi:hypothetical protein
MPTRILLADDETIQRMDLKEMLICSRTRCKNSKVLCYSCEKYGQMGYLSTRFTFTYAC